MATSTAHTTEKRADARERMIAVVKSVAAKHRDKLAEIQSKAAKVLQCEDWLWESLLLSFATMGRSAGAVLVRDRELHNKVMYKSLAKLPRNERKRLLKTTLRAAKLVRMPDKKANWLFDAFERISEMGGALSAKESLLSQPGREAKLRFLQSFDGIGPKYSRNMPMDVY